MLTCFVVCQELEGALASRSQIEAEELEAERQRVEREAEAERLRLAEEVRVREEAAAAARAEEEKEQQRQAKLRERAANIARLKPQARAKVLPLSVPQPHRLLLFITSIAFLPSSSSRFLINIMPHLVS